MSPIEAITQMLTTVLTAPFTTIENIAVAVISGSGGGGAKG
ncbi:hypothetical protein JMUB6875_54850 [Nocardia sp. JMUB6875]